MADPEVDVKDAAPEEKDKKKKPMMQSPYVKALMVVFAAILVFALFGWMTITLIQKYRGGEGTGIEPGVHMLGASITNPEAPEIIPIGDFTSIISDESGRSYNLKTTVLLTINKGGSRSKADVEAVKKEAEERKEQLTDAINEVLYGMEAQNFIGNSAHRVEGLTEMKASITRAVNAKMKLKIDGVLLPGFIFQ